MDPESDPEPERLFRIRHGQKVLDFSFEDSAFFLLLNGTSPCRKHEEDEDDDEVPKRLRIDENVQEEGE